MQIVSKGFLRFILFSFIWENADNKKDKQDDERFETSLRGF